MKAFKKMSRIICLVSCMVYAACSLSSSTDFWGRGYRYKHGGAFSGSDPVMSPDGTKIVFASPRDSLGDIYVINSDGTNLVRLTITPEYEGEPSFSPDGSKIVFVSERDDNGEIYIMDSNGSNQTRLTYNEVYDANPSFSPDGSEIIFVREVEEENFCGVKIVIINIDSSKERRLSNTGMRETDPSFSPDGTKILYRSGHRVLNEIRIMNVGNSQSVLVKQIDDCYCPSFSPDGRKIVFLAHWGSGVQGAREIFSMDVNGSNMKRLTFTDRAPIVMDSPMFTPDGYRILFLSEPEAGRHGQICIMNADGLDIRVIADIY